MNNPGGLISATVRKRERERERERKSPFGRDMERPKCYYSAESKPLQVIESVIYAAQNFIHSLGRRGIRAHENV